jgi:hypothetical protein
MMDFDLLTNAINAETEYEITFNKYCTKFGLASKDLHTFFQHPQTKVVYSVAGMKKMGRVFYIIGYKVNWNIDPEQYTINDSVGYHFDIRTFTNKEKWNYFSTMEDFFKKELALPC